MSYASLESSLEDGKPIYLYRFTLFPTVWRYTSADHDVMTSDGAVWKSVPISDSGIRQTGEANTDALTITAPITIGPAQVHLTAPPPRAIQVAMLRMNEGNSEVRAVYAGEISNVNPATPGQVTITCETTSATMQREGLRLGWQRSCPYALYDDLTCRASKVLYAQPMIVLSKVGYMLNVDFDEIRNGWFSGGFISWIHPVRGQEYRGIEAQSNNRLFIMGRVDDIYPGLRITAYPGCSRTVSDCINKFNNLANYGGIPLMPGKSPFDGDPVF